MKKHPIIGYVKKLTIPFDFLKILGSTPLFYAAKFPAVFKKLVEAGASVTATSFEGFNILHTRSPFSQLMQQYPKLVNQKSCTGMRKSIFTINQTLL